MKPNDAARKRRQKAEAEEWIKEAEALLAKPLHPPQVPDATQPPCIYKPDYNKANGK